MDERNSPSTSNWSTVATAQQSLLTTSKSSSTPYTADNQPYTLTRIHVESPADDNYFFNEDELQSREVKQTNSIRKEKKKKVKTVWKKIDDHFKNYRKESLGDFYKNMDTGSSSSSSEEENSEDKSFLELTKITKHKTEKELNERRGSRLKYPFTYAVMERGYFPCETHMECSSGERCIQGFCRTRCHSRACHYRYLKKYARQCRWSKDCLQGNHCDNHGYCTESCDEWKNPCHEDYQCYLGACIPSVALYERLCDTAADCLEKEVCGPWGKCSRACNFDNQCSKREKCIEGFCLNIFNSTYASNIMAVNIPLSTKKPALKCKSSEDCEEGFSCSNHGHCKRFCSMRKFICSKGN